MLRSALIVNAWVLVVGISHAEVKSKAIEYKYDGVTLKGHIFWDDAKTGKRPGVLVVHEWWGLNADARNRAKMLAELGYLAFACDMYGDGKVTEHPKEAGVFAGEVRKNMKTWLGRAHAALEVMKSHELCDATKLAGIGYCFGGSTVQQLAFDGADIKAVVSFHGAVVVPSEEQAKAAKAKILMCHGSADSFIKDEVIAQFRATLDKVGTDYQFNSYGGAKHSFTVRDAAKANVPGIEYQESADRRSWQDMQRLFNEVFAAKK